MSGRPRDKISLLIRNLSFFTSPQAVREAFEVHGPVRDVYLPLDFFTKKPRGFGFVEYQNEEDSYRALREMDGVVIDNKRIEVTVAKKGRSDPNAMVNTAVSTTDDPNDHHTSREIAELKEDLICCCSILQTKTITTATITLKNTLTALLPLSL
eukprot:GHVT01049879.1.p1 GENE.GHVT01049879.1~~GHVT01049879.1.p1  ORF type:complete len:154 (-),score=20.12 GHVT01049879.1:420-881(-)